MILTSALLRKDTGSLHWDRVGAKPELDSDVQAESTVFRERCDRFSTSFGSICTGITGVLPQLMGFFVGIAFLVGGGALSQATSCWTLTGTLNKKEQDTGKERKRSFAKTSNVGETSHLHHISRQLKATYPQVEESEAGMLNWSRMRTMLNDHASGGCGSFKSEQGA